jgi:hypothetical protein
MKRFTFTEKLLWLYIVLLPFREVPHLPILQQKLQYADLVFAILFISWIANYVKERFRIKWNYFDLSVGLLLLAYLPSFYNARNHLTCLIELLGLIYLAILLFTIKNIINSKEKLVYFIKIWVVVSVAVTLIGIAALIISLLKGELKTNAFLFYTEAEAAYHMLPRVDSVFRNANMYATYLLVSIVFGFILLYLAFKKKKERILLICALAILFLGAFLTASRQQVGIYLSSFLICAGINQYKLFRIGKYVLLSIFIILLIIAVSTTIWVVSPINLQNDIEKGILRVEINSKYSWHILPHETSIRMVKAHPFIGVGLGNYGNNFIKFADWQKVESRYGFMHNEVRAKAAQRRLVYDPLSTYLASFAETGVIGFIALLLLFSRFIISLQKNYQSSQDDFKRKLSWFILAGFFGFLINGFVAEILTMRHFWILMALGIAVINSNNLKEGNRDGND